MLKEVTRTLYIDGKLIADWTQDPWEDSELSDNFYPPQSSFI